MDTKMLLALLFPLFGASFVPAYASILRNLPYGTKPPPIPPKGECDLAADPYNLNAFIQIDAGGKRVRIYCSYGLEFDPKTCVCNYPDPRKTYLKGPTPPPPTTTRVYPKPTSEPPVKGVCNLRADPYNPGAFKQEIPGGTYVQMYCPYGLVYNPDSCGCGFQDPDSPYVSPPSSYPKPTTDPPVPGVCDLKEDPSNAGAYFQEIPGGSYEHKYCSRGLVYNSDICGCDFPDPDSPYVSPPSSYPKPTTDPPVPGVCDLKEDPSNAGAYFQEIPGGSYEHKYCSRGLVYISDICGCDFPDPDSPYVLPPSSYPKPTTDPPVPGVCDLKEDPSNAGAYFQEIPGGSYERKYCSRGLVYNSDICGCDFPVVYPTPPPTYVEPTEPTTRSYYPPRTTQPPQTPPPYVPPPTTQPPQTPPPYVPPPTTQPPQTPTPYVPPSTTQPPQTPPPSTTQPTPTTVPTTVPITVPITVPTTTGATAPPQTPIPRNDRYFSFDRYRPYVPRFSGRLFSRSRRPRDDDRPRG